MRERKKKRRWKKMETVFIIPNLLRCGVRRIASCSKLNVYVKTKHKKDPVNHDNTEGEKNIYITVVFGGKSKNIEVLYCFYETKPQFSHQFRNNNNKKKNLSIFISHAPVGIILIPFLCKLL